MVINVRLRRIGRRERHAIRTWRVFWRGEEITRDTFYVDGRRRVARCFATDGNGRRYLVRDRFGEPHVATVERRGVRIVRHR